MISSYYILILQLGQFLSIVGIRNVLSQRPFSEISKIDYDCNHQLFQTISSHINFRFLFKKTSQFIHFQWLLVYRCYYQNILYIILATQQYTTQQQYTRHIQLQINPGQNFPLVILSHHIFLFRTIYTQQQISQLSIFDDHLHSGNEFLTTTSLQYSNQYSKQSENAYIQYENNNTEYPELLGANRLTKKYTRPTLKQLVQNPTLCQNKLNNNMILQILHTNNIQTTSTSQQMLIQQKHIHQYNHIHQLNTQSHKKTPVRMSSASPKLQFKNQIQELNQMS